MSDRSIDRHKTPRSYKSGFDKAKEKKDKQKKDEELLSQTHKITNFFVQIKRLTRIHLTILNLPLQ